MLSLVKLEGLQDRLPAQLSGGQQQRVALARALVFEPQLVLMDEPLGALDKRLREHMQLELKRIHARVGVTIVYVTHDQGEALAMSDRIAVFSDGRIRQLATPSELYEQPTDALVADFVGENNRIEGTPRMSAATVPRPLRRAASMSRATCRGRKRCGTRRRACHPARTHSARRTSSQPRMSFRGSSAGVVYLGDHARLEIMLPGGARCSTRISNDARTNCSCHRRSGHHFLAGRGLPRLLPTGSGHNDDSSRRHLMRTHIKNIDWAIVWDEATDRHAYRNGCDIVFEDNAIVHAGGPWQGAADVSGRWKRAA